MNVLATVRDAETVARPADAPRNAATDVHDDKVGAAVRLPVSVTRCITAGSRPWGTVHEGSLRFSR